MANVAQKTVYALRREVERCSHDRPARHGHRNDGRFRRFGRVRFRSARTLPRIGEVLMATAIGLFIAIPAFIAYYDFRNVRIVIVNADDMVNIVNDIPYEELAGIKIGENFDWRGRSRHRLLAQGLDGIDDKLPDLQWRGPARTKPVSPLRSYS